MPAETECTTISTNERIKMHVQRPRCPRCDSTRLKATGSPSKGKLKIRYSACRDCGQKLLLVVE